MTTKEEGVAFAKRRALELLDAGEPLSQVLASMGSDLNKAGVTGDSMTLLYALGLQHAMADDRDEMRRWVNGF